MIRQDRVEDRMRRRHWSYRRLTSEANKTRPGLSYSTVWDVVHGKREPSLDVVQALASALETSTWYLLGETDQAEPAEPPLSAEALDLARRMDDLPVTVRQVVKRAFDDLLLAFEPPLSRELLSSFLTALFEDAPEEDKAVLERAMERWETRRCLRVVGGAAEDQEPGPGDR